MPNINIDGQFEDIVTFDADFGVIQNSFPSIDTTVTADSPNPVASSGIYEFVKDIEEDLDTRIDGVSDSVTTETNNRSAADLLLQNQIDSKASTTALNAKQDTLVSGTNIKTINGNSILGSGNIVIQGGGTGGNVDDVTVNGVSVLGSDKVARVNIPTNVSSFTNDAGYITESSIPTVPTKTSDLTNDSGFITSSDIPSIPSKTSDLTNDSGFITAAYVPTKTSQLTNDSDYTTTEQVAGQLDLKQDKLTAGTNITISEDNVISATGGSGGSTVTMADNAQGGVDLTVDGTSKTLAKQTSVTDLNSALNKLNNTTETPIASGKVWGTTSNGADWIDVGGSNEFELIEEITLNELVSSVTRNSFPDGTPFSLKAMQISVMMKPTDTSATKYMAISINGKIVLNSYIRHNYSPTLSANPFWIMYGRLMGYTVSCYPYGDWAASGVLDAIRTEPSCSGTFACSSIQSVSLNTTYLNVGTVIRIYGVRA